SGVSPFSRGFRVDRGDGTWRAMSPRMPSRRPVFTFVAVLGSIAAALLSASPARAASGASIASTAVANVGKGACSTNSLGGTDYGTSCTGNGGSPEYWCADFALWVWAAAGVNTAGLTAGAGSFYVYGQNNATLDTAGTWRGPRMPPGSIARTSTG